MLNLKFTRIIETTTRNVVSGVNVDEEGMAMVFEKEGLETKVRPSTGVSGELFAGVALGRSCYPYYLPMVQTGLIEDDGVVSLLRDPIDTQTMIKVEGDSVPKHIITSGNPTAAQVLLDGVNAIFNVADKGKKYIAQFKYVPSAAESRIASSGDTHYAPVVSSSLRSVGLLRKGDISTSNYDASVDWSTVLTVNLGANGVFTSGGTGTLVPNAVVLNVPNSENAMLTLSLG